MKSRESHVVPIVAAVLFSLISSSLSTSESSEVPATWNRTDDESVHENWTKGSFDPRNRVRNEEENDGDIDDDDDDEQASNIVNESIHRFNATGNHTGELNKSLLDSDPVDSADRIPMEANQHNVSPETADDEDNSVDDTKASDKDTSNQNFEKDYDQHTTDVGALDIEPVEDQATQIDANELLGGQEWTDLMENHGEKVASSAKFSDPTLQVEQTSTEPTVIGVDKTANFEEIHHAENSNGTRKLDDIPFSTSDNMSSKRAPDGNTDSPVNEESEVKVDISSTVDVDDYNDTNQEDSETTAESPRRYLYH